MPKIVASDGTKLYVEEIGCGTPVVFVHEYAGDYRSWEPQMRYFSRQHRCVTYSQRGYPPSDVPDDPTRYGQDMARSDVIAIMDALGIEKAHVVGHSMGAYTAVHVGLHHPDRCISVPAAGWITKGPQTFAALEEKLSALQGPVTFVRHGMDQLEHLMQGAPPPGAPAALSLQQPSNLESVGLSILLGTQHVVGRLFVLVVVLFFLLASGDSFLRKIVEVTPTFSDKRRVVIIFNEVEQNVSGYLVTITIMNTLVGFASGLAMYFCGMPDPLLWGTLAFLLNYIPILGPMATLVIFFAVGLLSSSDLWHAVIPPRSSWRSMCLRERTSRRCCSPVGSP